jgi:hypothetical protein
MGSDGIGSVPGGPLPGSEQDTKLRTEGMGSKPHYDRLADLAWFSHLIVRGTVVEEHPGIDRVAVDAIGKGENYRLIEEYYVVTPWIIQVHDVLRGTAWDEIRVITMGGETEKQIFVNHDAPPLAEGRSFVFFLEAEPAHPGSYGI